MSCSLRLVCMMALVFAGCGSETEPPNSESLILPDAGLDMSMDALPIQATVRVINPARGSGFSGVTVRSELGEATTDDRGSATVEIAVGKYELELMAPNARVHRVSGTAQEDFEQITYLSPDNITSFVFGSLGLSVDPERGILVVGLDTPSLAPALGGSGAEVALLKLSVISPRRAASVSAVTLNSISCSGKRS